MVFSPCLNKGYDDDDDDDTEKSLVNNTCESRQAWDTAWDNYLHEILLVKALAHSLSMIGVNHVGMQSKDVGLIHSLSLCSHSAVKWFWGMEKRHFMKPLNQTSKVRVLLALLK